MESLRRVAAKVDDAVFRLERLLLLVSLGMMTVLVALDVIQRTFSRPVGKTDALLLWLLYKEPTEAQVAFVTGTLGPILFAVFSAAFCVLATHSGRAIGAEKAQQAAPKLGLSVGLGLAVFVGLTLFVQAVLWVFPSSVPGAQKFALGFMLWSGLLGASLATRSRRHIILDPIKKKLDPETLKPFSLLGGLVTFGFCALIALLGTMQWWDQFHEWREGENIGVYDALPIPLWVTTLAVPVTFATMALRFLGQGVHDFVWGPPKGGADSHGIDLEALEKEGAPGGEGGAA